MINQIEVGGRPKGTTQQLDLRQQKFVELYCDTGSATYSNCYQSALAAGYTEQTARNLSHNRPTWLSDKLGQLRVFEPQDLVAKLSQIIDNPHETTANQLKAIDMLLKVNNMYRPAVHTFNQINIQSVLD